VAIPPAGSDMGSLNSDRRFPHLILSRAFLFQLSKNLTPIPQPGSHRLTGADLVCDCTCLMEMGVADAEARCTCWSWCSLLMSFGLSRGAAQPWITRGPLVDRETPRAQKRAVKRLRKTEKKWFKRRRRKAKELFKRQELRVHL
jgi:hypothetical protein